MLSDEERRQWRRFAPTLNVRVVRNPYVRTMSNSASGASAVAALSTERSDKQIVLFVGRLLAAKGVFDLLEAFRLARQEVDCSLTLVGEGPERQELSRAIARYGLAEVVTMPGHLGGDDLRRVYREATVFVLPSYREGFPTVIAEAMDAGLPIVTTNIRGAADVLAQETNALFVPPGEPELLAENLVRLLRDTDLRARMGIANAEKVAEFEPGIVAQEFVKLLQSL